MAAIAKWSEGIGRLKVDMDMLDYFVRRRPPDLRIIGLEACDELLHNRIYVIVRGPQIPTIDPADEVECVVTRLEDGSLEWDFCTPMNPMSPKAVSGTCQP